MTEGELLWTPDPADAAASTVARFMRRLADERGLSFATYEELWRWSVRDLDGFWSAVWEFFDVHSTQPYERVVDSRAMPGAVWFRGSRVNYAEHLLRHERRAAPGEAALVHSSELRPLATTSWHELGAAVRVLATQLRALGVVPGRPRRGVHAEHPRDGDRDARGDGDRRGVVVGRAGVRRAHRHRPLRADRAEAALRRRRLPLRRQGLRPCERAAHDPRGAADRRARRVAAVSRCGRAARRSRTRSRGRS